VAAVAARVVMRDDMIEEARVALGAVAPVPLRARGCEALLAGQRLDGEQPPAGGLLARAARRAAEEAQPISDLRGSADYRRRLVAVLAERALVAAAARARAA